MLQKKNIFLRAPEPEDVDFLYQLENNQQLWHLSNTRFPFSRFDLEQFVMQSEKDVFTSRQARFIIDKLTGDTRKTVGAIDLFDVEAKHRRAGTGIMVVEDERGKGVASTALDILIDYAFSVLDLHQLYCNIETDNENSLRLFAAKGFLTAGKRLEWNFRNGNWVDEYFLQLINKQKHS
ncbi:MAG: GNAT family N-acetyltransferase [Bacteroidales bacterium]|nr:GNAT family N-acetyltransferase [Bacteroidales bacterium]